MIMSIRLRASASVATPPSRTPNSSPASRATTSCRPTGPVQAGAYGAQQPVADAVPEAVVDVLEAVEVDDDDGQRRVTRLEPVGELLEEQRPVAERSELVVGRLVAQRRRAGR